MSELRTLKIVFNKQTYIIELTKNDTFQSFTEKIHAQTEIQPQYQKIIFKGKILSKQIDLNSIPNNQKLMLMYTSTASDDRNRPVVSQVAVARQMLAQKNQQLKEKNKERKTEAKILTNSEKEQSFQMWKLTGTINLKDLQLKNLSTQESEIICEISQKVKIVDFRGNQFTQIPTVLSQLSNLQRLRLSQNQLADQISENNDLILAKSIKTLCLDNNLFRQIPSQIMLIQCLRRLDISNNQIQGGIMRADQFGKYELRNLEEFKISNNQLETLLGLEKLAPNLQYFDAANNKIQDLPKEISEMKLLKVMILNQNQISSVPSYVFIQCSKLCRLELHNNKISMQQLREQEGFEQLESRRQAHYDKKIDMDVLGYDGFDEGLDYD